LDFEKDFEALERDLVDTDQRIKKLEEHKEFAEKEIRGCKSDNKTMIETLRRLERNLDNLHKKRELIIKELEN